MAAVEQAALEDALYHLRVARTYSGVLFIGVVISIGSHAAEYWDSAAWLPWLVHWFALWFGAGTLIAMLLVLLCSTMPFGVQQQFSQGLQQFSQGYCWGTRLVCLGHMLGHQPRWLPSRPGGDSLPRRVPSLRSVCHRFTRGDARTAGPCAPPRLESWLSRPRRALDARGRCRAGEAQRGGDVSGCVAVCVRVRPFGNNTV